MSKYLLSHLDVNYRGKNAPMFYKCNVKEKFPHLFSFFVVSLLKKSPLMMSLVLRWHLLLSTLGMQVTLSN